MCMFMCLCTYICVHMYMEAGVFRDNSSPLNLNLNDVARLPGYRAPGIHCLRLFSVGITGVYWI